MRSWGCKLTAFRYEGGFPDGEVEIEDRKTGAVVTLRAVDLLRFVGLRVRDYRITALEQAEPTTLVLNG